MLIHQKLLNFLRIRSLTKPLKLAIYGTKKVGDKEDPIYENEVPVTDFNGAAKEWNKFLKND